MKVPNGTSIYLQFGRKIKIPVNPSDISIKRPSNNKTYEVLDKGEIVVPMPAGLTEVSFESFIPSDSSVPYANSSISPKAFVKALESAKKNKTKGRLIISRSGLFDTNLRCIIEEFETKGKDRSKFCKLPFIRGLFNMYDSLTFGYKCLMRSAELTEKDVIEYMI
jgi:hypothetical protein